jgi:chaperone modulatory protein CbpM
MKISVAEWIYLDDQGICSAEHLMEISGLSDTELGDLIDTGVIPAVDDTAQVKSFALRHVVTAKIARKLRDDFELDLQGLTLAMTLVRRIESLESALKDAKIHLDRTIANR